MNIQERLSRLEKKNRYLSLMTIVSACLLLAMITIAMTKQGGEIHDYIRTKHLAVVDCEGQPVISFSSNGDRGSIELYGELRKRSVTIDYRGIAVYNKKGKYVFMAGPDYQDNGCLRLWDKHEGTDIQIGTQLKDEDYGSGYININGDNGYLSFMARDEVEHINNPPPTTPPPQIEWPDSNTFVYVENLNESDYFHKREKGPKSQKYIVGCGIYIGKFPRKIYVREAQKRKLSPCPDCFPECYSSNFLYEWRSRKSIIDHH